jgi:catechol 2,3-dioxygenase-like lactoylglutathione lyase family enzyme
MRFYSVRLLVEDFDACFRFYRDTIGLEPVWGEEGGRYADFKIGNGTLLALFKRDLMATTLGTQQLPSDAPAQDRAAIVLQTDDLDGTVSTLLAKGAPFVTEPKDYSAWTIRAAHLRDPDGNLIELFMALPEERWTEESREADRRARDRLSE